MKQNVFRRQCLSKSWRQQFGCYSEVDYNWMKSYLVDTFTDIWGNEHLENKVCSESESDRQNPEQKTGNRIYFSILPISDLSETEIWY